MDNKTRLELKTQIYEQFARVAKSFGNPRRLEIIDLLSQAPHTVEDLATKTDMSVASVSQHLQVLKNARLVKSKRDGTYIWYRLSDNNVFAVWKSLRDLAHNINSEIDNLVNTYFSERQLLESISVDELLKRINNDDIILLDVRPHDEYEAGHIPNAVSIPLDELERRLESLPKDIEIIAYCRAPYCLFSDRAALYLQEKGYTVKIYKEGLPEWRNKGLPVEISATSNHPYN